MPGRYRKNINAAKGASKKISWHAKHSSWYGHILEHVWFEFQSEMSWLRQKTVPGSRKVFTCSWFMLYPICISITWNQCVFNASVGRINLVWGRDAHLLQTDLTSLHLCSNAFSHSRLQLFTLQGFCYTGLYHAGTSAYLVMLNICSNIQVNMHPYVRILGILMQLFASTFSYVINKKCGPGVVFLV